MLLLAACSAAPVSVERPRASLPTNPIPSSTAPAPSSSERTRERIEHGTLEVVVTDASGRRRPDVVVHVGAPDGSTLRRITDAQGLVRERLRAGTYRVTVPVGCRGRMQVRFGASGRVGLTERSIVRAPLRVEAIRRYAAGPPLLRSREPPWRRGAGIDLLFRVYDRCTDTVMREFSFGDLGYRPSAHIEVLDTYDMRTDPEAFGRVRVRCRRPGPARLILGDPINTADGQDILAFTPPLDPTAEWCA